MASLFFNYGPWRSAHCLHLFTDAAVSTGHGALFGTHWFYGSRPSEWHTEAISFLELYPIMTSVCVRAAELVNHIIIIYTDNEALESVINKSTSKHKGMVTLVRRLVMTCDV